MQHQIDLLHYPRVLSARDSSCGFHRLRSVLGPQEPRDLARSCEHHRDPVHDLEELSVQHRRVRRPSDPEELSVQRHRVRPLSDLEDLCVRHQKFHLVHVLDRSRDGDFRVHPPDASVLLGTSG